MQTGTGCIYLQVRWKRYDRDCHEPEHVYPGEGRGGTLYSEEYMAIQPEDREEDEAEHVRGYCGRMLATYALNSTAVTVAGKVGT